MAAQSTSIGRHFKVRLKNSATVAATLALGVAPFCLDGEAKAQVIPPIPPIATFECVFGGAVGDIQCKDVGIDGGTPVPVFGDKVLSNFRPIPDIAQVPGSISYSWNDADGVADLDYSDDIWIFAVNATPTFVTSTPVGPLSYGYDVTIIDPDWEFEAVGLESDVNALTSRTQVIKTTSANGIETDLESVNGAPVGSGFFVVQPNVKTISITDTFSLTPDPTNPLINQASLTSITNAWTQRRIASVPGPLPLFGAGVAFGFSRRLRKRISLKTVSS